VKKVGEHITARISLIEMI